jgi:hypothetical protein
VEELKEHEISLLKVSITSFLCIKLRIIDSEASVESPLSESPPTEFSDWDGFSDTLSFDSASDAFTDNHTDSEPEEIESSWIYTTAEEYNEAMARRRYQRRRNRHIQERDQRRFIKQLKEVDLSQFDDDNTLFDQWTTELEQDQDQDQIQVQILAEIQDQELHLDQDTVPQKLQYQDQELDQGQDTRSQKRQYSNTLDSTDPESRDRRYPLRKRRLTAKAAALIIY